MTPRRWPGFSNAGFTTIEVKSNLDAKAFRGALADFETIARGADVAVVYYSGHGFERDGQTYLVPVDAARSPDIKDEAISLARVLASSAVATRLNLVLLDACRNDPATIASPPFKVKHGLAESESSKISALIFYAAKAGTCPIEGESGGNSPFTAALLRHLTTPGLDIALALRRVREDVLVATHGKQEPFFYGSVSGDELPLVAKDGPNAPDRTTR